MRQQSANKPRPNGVHGAEPSWHAAAALAHTKAPLSSPLQHMRYAMLMPQHHHAHSVNTSAETKQGRHNATTAAGAGGYPNSCHAAPLSHTQVPEERTPHAKGAQTDQALPRPAWCCKAAAGGACALRQPPNPQHSRAPPCGRCEATSACIGGSSPLRHLPRPSGAAMGPQPHLPVSCYPAAPTCLQESSQSTYGSPSRHPSPLVPCLQRHTARSCAAVVCLPTGCCPHTPLLPVWGLQRSVQGGPRAVHMCITRDSKTVPAKGRAVRTWLVFACPRCAPGLSSSCCRLWLDLLAASWIACQCHCCLPRAAAPATACLLRLAPSFSCAAPGAAGAPQLPQLLQPATRWCRCPGCCWLLGQRQPRPLLQPLA